MCWHSSAYMLVCPRGAMIVFHKLCRTAWSLREHRTESVSVMGHTRSVAVSSTGSTIRNSKTCQCIWSLSGQCLLSPYNWDKKVCPAHYLLLAPLQTLHRQTFNEPECYDYCNLLWEDAQLGGLPETYHGELAQSLLTPTMWYVAGSATAAPW